MEELWSPSDHLEEEKIVYKRSEKHKSSGNEGVTCSMKNKRKEKVLENFIGNKVSYKAIILWYILVLTRKKGQSFFYLRWREQ